MFRVVFPRNCDIVYAIVGCLLLVAPVLLVGDRLFNPIAWLMYR